MGEGAKKKSAGCFPAVLALLLPVGILIASRLFPGGPVSVAHAVVDGYVKDIATGDLAAAAGRWLPVRRTSGEAERSTEQLRAAVGPEAALDFDHMLENAPRACVGGRLRGAKGTLRFRAFLREVAGDHWEIDFVQTWSGNQDKPIGPWPADWHGQTHRTVSGSCVD